ncbi:hypothetical protein EI94DRAFT_180645 [Lactarius quietus]|nr:hypothetical protein EI94DRAFT_180645 [Lactarius quietus]
MHFLFCFCFLIVYIIASSPIIYISDLLGLCKCKQYNYNFKGKLSLVNKIKLFKSLPAIHNLILNDSSHHHLIIAILLILKHAMFFRHSNVSQLDLSQAEQNYQVENIDSKILEYLKEVTPEKSVKQFSEFIMATDIVSTQASIDISE